MCIKYYNQFDEQVGAIKTYLSNMEVASWNNGDFDDIIYNKLISILHIDKAKSPYGFVIIRDANPNNEENACCPVYMTEIEYCSQQFIIFYLEYINVNKFKYIYAFRIYSARSPYEQYIKNCNLVSGIKDVGRPEQRATLIASSIKQGYKFPDNVESCRASLISYIRRCYESHRRVSLTTRERLSLHGYCIVEHRIIDQYGRVVS